jgi:hypothetical protein
MFLGRSGPGRSNDGWRGRGDGGFGAHVSAEVLLPLEDALPLADEEFFELAE